MKTSKTMIYHLRTKYGLKHFLDESSIPANPFALFESWMNSAIKEKVTEPNAMNFSTVNKKGMPSSRVVLLRGFDKNGFVFYTNYHSRKANDLKVNPRACVTFYWQKLEKQVRIEGKIKKVLKHVSDEYFGSRPRMSQVSAWASEQSRVLESREELDRIVENLTNKYKGKKIPRPAHWGGYCLVPISFEFWQGRPDRLHDRILYKKTKDSWKINRLFP
ncbi:MAG TPA: pyridoxamine 5'-phosphate oxidase [Ignavibacteriaceae bacterium]|nr:pyridoxamine 5'-phosphate oxidase [Ignavibacteriaceae bacterium]